MELETVPDFYLIKGDQSEIIQLLIIRKSVVFLWDCRRLSLNAKRMLTGSKCLLYDDTDRL